MIWETIVLNIVSQNTILYSTLFRFAGPATNHRYSYINNLKFNNRVQYWLFMKFASIICLVFLSTSTLFGQDQVHPDQLLMDVQILASDSLEGRRTGTSGGKKAKAYLLSRFSDVGLKGYTEDYCHPFDLDQESGANLIGYIPGKTDQVIVISAHYDHLGVQDGKIFNGADDNASGVAGILAIAEAFKNSKPNHTLVFVAFDAEEQGLIGSKVFTTNPPIPLDRIRLNINLDMIAHNNQNEIYAAGGFHYEMVVPIIKKVNELSIVNVIAGHDSPGTGWNDWTNSSDHGPFHSKKIPFIYFGVEDHPDYHKPTDDYEKINEDFFIEVVKMIIETVMIADQEID